MFKTGDIVKFDKAKTLALGETFNGPYTARVLKIENDGKYFHGEVLTSENWHIALGKHECRFVSEYFVKLPNRDKRGRFASKFTFEAQHFLALVERYGKLRGTAAGVAFLDNLKGSVAANVALAERFGN